MWTGRSPRREHEKLEQVREIYGEQAYEDRKRAWERASQPPVPSRGSRRAICRSTMGRNAADRSGTLGPAAERLGRFFLHVRCENI